MSKEAVQRFVTTIPLRPTQGQEKQLRIKFEAARQGYNALLGEYRRRLDLMRQSRAWKKARNMAKGPERTKLFRDLEKQFKYREYDLYPFIQRMRKHPGIGLHLDAHTVMALSARACQTCQRHQFKGGKIQFRRRDELNSVEGINADSSIQWQGNRLRFGNKLMIAAEIDPADNVIAHGLRHRVVYSRIIRRAIRGKNRYYAQLINEGVPYHNPNQSTKPGVVGLDVGPSTIAIVGDESVSFQKFCDPLAIAAAHRRRLQRRLSRRMRINNRDCFTASGTGIKGKRIRWTRGMQRAKAELAETLRKEREHRKNLHHRLAVGILAMGNDIRTEKLSYRAFQRRFGKSVGNRAPGLFIATLKAVANKLGGCVTEFDTRTTRLSQVCLCGAIRKKSLSERVHRCACGITAHRDIFSAHLSRFVQGDRLDMASARKGWTRFCNTAGAISGDRNDAMGQSLLCARPIAESTEASSRRKPVDNPSSASDVVAGQTAQARADERAEVCGESTVQAVVLGPIRSQVVGVVVVESASPAASHQDHSVARKSVHRKGAHMAKSFDKHAKKTNAPKAQKRQSANAKKLKSSTQVSASRKLKPRPRRSRQSREKRADQLVDAVVKRLSPKQSLPPDLTVVDPPGDAERRETDKLPDVTESGGTNLQVSKVAPGRATKFKKALKLTGAKNSKLFKKLAE